MMIKSLAQFTGVVIASSLSPCGPLLTWVLKDYFNVTNALMGPKPFFAELRHFCMMVEAYPDVVKFQLIPALVVIVLLGLVFLAVFSRVFEMVICQVAEKLGVNTTVQAKG